MLRALVGSAASAVDVIATRAAYWQTSRARARNRAESLGHAERMTALSAIAARYHAGAHGDYFRAGRAASWHETPVRTLPNGGRVVDVRWDSAYATFLPDLADRYHAYLQNQRAAARLWLHREPRPALVLVHGYLGGVHAFEERMWPTTWLYRMGLDVAFFVLPFHGVRGVKKRIGPPPFPSSDPRFTNEGFRQALGDLCDLAARLQQDGREVGVMGMSLGGYTTALAATVEPRLACAIPVIPLGSLADFARDQGRLGRSAVEAEREHAALDAAHRIISPLHRAPAVRGERVLVIGAEADRITPLRHAERLAAHFGAELETWPGGHLLQIGRGDAFRLVARRLEALSMTRR